MIKRIKVWAEGVYKKHPLLWKIFITALFFAISTSLVLFAVFLDNQLNELTNI